MPNSINSSSRYHSDSNSGFTLIELLVTIVVLGVIVSIAAPSISTQLANQRVKSTTATLINALREAKAESVIRRQPVTVSYINDAESSNVSIQVPAPLSAAYSSPTLFSSAAVARDWTSLFMSSAMAANPNANEKADACEKCAKTGAPGQCKKCFGGETGGGETGGGETDGGETDGGETDGGETGGGGTGGGETGGGEAGGGEAGGGEAGGGEAGGGEAGGGEAGGGETGGGETGGDVQASNLVSIATYKYAAKTLIESDDTKITFYPSKRTDKGAAFTYNICDGNNSVSPRQVTVNALGVISSKLGGTC